VGDFPYSVFILFSHFFAVAQQLKLRDIFEEIQLREQVKLRGLTVKALRGEYRV